MMRSLKCFIAAMLLTAGCCAQNMYTNLTNDIQINSMTPDGEYIWFTTSTALFKYDTLSGNIQRFDVANSPLYSGFSLFDAPATGNKIASGYADSYYQFYNDAKGLFQLAYVSLNDFFTGPFADNYGHVWSGGSSNVLYYDGSTWQVLTTLNGVALNGNNGSPPYVAVDKASGIAWLYYQYMNKMFKCDSAGNWASFNVPSLSPDQQQVWNYLDDKTNMIYAHNGMVYILSQPLGASSYQLLTWTNSSFVTSALPGGDYVLHVTFKPDGSIKLPHGNVNQTTGAYRYGVYYYNPIDSAWKDEFIDTGNAPFATHIVTQENAAFIDADDEGNMYFAFGYDGDSITPTGLWRLKPGNTWERIKLGNVDLKFNTAISRMEWQDTAGNLYRINGTQRDCFKTDNSVVHNSINYCIDTLGFMAAACDNKNNVWGVGYKYTTDTSDTNYLINMSTCSIYTVPHNIYSRVVTCYKDKVYCAGTYSNSYGTGVACLSNGNFTFVDAPLQYGGQGALFDPILCMATDSNLFMTCMVRDTNVGGSNYDNILYYDSAGIWKLPFPGQTQTMGMAVDTQGQMWVTVRDNDSVTLYMYNGHQWVTEASIYGWCNANNICIDRHNVISFWASSGMYQINGNTRKTYPLGPAAAYFSCSGMYPRSDGSIVLDMGQQGLDIFNPGGIPPADTLPVGFNLVKGRVFYDLDSNGIFSDGDAPLQYTTMVTDGQSFAATDMSGNYDLITSAGNQTVRVVLPPYTYAIPADTCVVHFASTASYNDSVVNFSCYRIPGMQDLATNISVWPLVPGSDSAVYWLSVYNYGSNTVNAQLVFKYDSSLTFLNSAYDSAVITGNTVVWPFAALAPGINFSFPVTFYVSSNDTIGQAITAVSLIYPFSNDNNPRNNTDTALSYVVSSFDPNEKYVSPTGEIDTSTTLTYTIMFQNTGTYTAANVAITDSIDQLLDFSTFKILASSAPCSWHVNNRLLTFTFSNINLPDSGTGTIASTGFVKYSIKPLAWSPGGVVKNKANVYFDYNLPVVTNTTVNTLPFNPAYTFVQTPAANDIAVKIWPNPNAGTFRISFANEQGTTCSIQMFDLTGRLIYQNTTQSTEIVVNCNAFNSGVYTCRLSGNGYCSANKVVITR